MLGTSEKQRGQSGWSTVQEGNVWERREGRWLVTRSEGALEARARCSDFILL